MPCKLRALRPRCGFPVLCGQNKGGCALRAISTHKAMAEIKCPLLQVALQRGS